MAITYFDLETVAREGADVLLSAPTANKTLKDPAKIADDLAAKAAKQLEQLSLDPYGCRIVCASWHRTGRDEEPIHVWPCVDEAAERDMLSVLLSDLRNSTICGYNVKGFDLPVLRARCQLLGVPYPYTWDSEKWPLYATDVADLFARVSSRFQDYAISRSLTSMCRVFGVDVPQDDISGNWVAQAIAQGEWQMVQDHCQRDVERVMALAQRLRVVDLRDVDREAVTA